MWYVLTLLIQAKNSWANLDSFLVFARASKTNFWVLVCIVCVIVLNFASGF